MWQYINEQTEVLQAIIKNEHLLVDLLKIDKPKIIITASGSSLNAALLLKPLFNTLKGVEVIIENPFQLRFYSAILKENREDKVLIALSQTGKSTGTLDCIDIANNHGIHTIAITNDVTSPIAMHAKYHVDMNCGIEDVGPKTKGFSATVLVLHRLLMKLYNVPERIILEEYQRSILEITSNIKEAKIWAKNHPSWAKAPSMSVVGFGVNDGIAKEGALKILETMQIPVMNYDLEEYMHGPHRTIVEDSYIILIDTMAKGSTFMKNLISFVEGKTDNYLIISTNRESDSHTISIGEYEATSSWLNAVVIFQVLCTYFPEVNGIDSSKPIYQNFAKEMGTRL